MATPADKVKALLGDLGKATLRGVRKCPKCGTYNGTRGISCKNKNCDVVFKDKERKRGHSADAVKIITGSTVQVFSVRLRDRGPDYRGFVQLPLIQDLDGNPAQIVEPSVLAQTARCYVDSCTKSTDAAAALPQEPCLHMKSALECTQEAHPLTLKNSVLNSLQVSNETKQAIWLLATETTGPLVQRVTKNIMVVKCKANPKQPLGFLHFAFFETSRNRSEPEHKFMCSCKAFKNFRFALTKDEGYKRCVHFYACVCAFASDDKLSSEFSFYINLDNTSFLADDTDIVSAEPLLAVYGEQEEEEEEEDEVVSAPAVVDPDTMEVVVLEQDFSFNPPIIKKKKKDDTIIAQASSALLTLQEGGTASDVTAVSPRKSSPGKPTSTKVLLTPKKTTPLTADHYNESLVVVTFHQWLSSVTERINQTMHYQFDGNPEPLVFHAPQIFFDCLQQRISAGNKKKRLPNSTTGFLRKDALPLGLFTKYTWHITSTPHVKQIFDTTEMPLEVTRHFLENRDGTYELFNIPKVHVEAIDDTYKAKNQAPIKPFELKTYLKVGTPNGEKEAIPFIIEWIPDILPKSRIGELRIKFEYGHQRNGLVEQRTISMPSEIQTITLQEINNKQL